jgi:FAD/FMN-containing dehydrogenase
VTTDARARGRIPEDSLHALGLELDGKILQPDDDGFAEAVLIWNGMIAKVLGAVVRAASGDDVVATVNFARQHGVELSVKGGGHNIAGLALSDGGLTLDLSQLRAVEVDPEARIAV